MVATDCARAGKPCMTSSATARPTVGGRPTEEILFTVLLLPAAQQRSPRGWRLPLVGSDVGRFAAAMALGVIGRGEISTAGVHSRAARLEVQVHL